MRLGLALSAAALSAAAPAWAADLNLISKVEVKDQGSTVLVTIEGNRPPSFTTFSMTDPPRFVIDISESQFQNVPEDIVIGDDTINLVKNLSYGSAETSIARVMVAFNREVDPPDVQTTGTALVVRIARPAPPAGAGVARAQPVEPSASEAQRAAEAAARAEAEEKARAEAAARAKAEAEAQARALAEAEARAEAQAQAKADAEAKAKADAEAKAKADAAARQAAAPAAGTGAGAVAAGAAGPGGAAAGGAAAPRAADDQAALEAERARQEKENQELLAWREAQGREAEAAAKKEEERRVEVQRLDEANRQRAAEEASRQRAAEEARARAELEQRPAAPEASAPAAVPAPAEAPAPAPAPAEATAVAPAPPPAATAEPGPAEKERLAAIERRPAPERLEMPAKPRQVREIGFQQLAEVSRVFVRLSGAPSFQVTEVEENVIQVELANTRAVRRNDTRFLDTSYFPSAVAMVTPKRQGSSYVVEIRLKQRVQWQQKVEGDTLAIDFERPASMREGPAAEPAAPGAAGVPAAPEPAAPAAPESPEPPGGEPPPKAD